VLRTALPEPLGSKTTEKTQPTKSKTLNFTRVRQSISPPGNKTTSRQGWGAVVITLL
jgi:hypothetical protein